MNGFVERPERQHSVEFDGTCCKQFQISNFNLGIATFMLQVQGGGVQLVSYWARKVNPTERGNTYYAYNFEALAVCEAVKHWR
jgi:hypothetical protein